MKKKILIISLLFIVVSIIIFTHTSYARYISNSIWDYYLSSNNFYFESDYLDKNIKNNIYNSWDGNSISFNLKNGLSNDIYTKDDIKYEVSCITLNEASCLVNGESVYKAILKGNTFTTETLSFRIEGDADLTNVTVIAKAISPYKKTISANFELNRIRIKNTINYDLVDYGNYSKLNISNYSNNDKCLSVSYSADNIHVLEDSNMQNIQTDDDGYINGFEIDIQHNDTVSINIYNTDSIDNTDFTVLECQ